MPKARRMNRLLYPVWYCGLCQVNHGGTGFTHDFQAFLGPFVEGIAPAYRIGAVYLCEECARDGRETLAMGDGTLCRQCAA